MNRRDVLGALALWSVGATAGWAWDEPGDPVGRLVTHTGMVRVVRSGKVVKPRPQMRLRVGDRMELAAAARAEVVHTPAGTRYRLGGPATVRVREDLMAEVVLVKAPPGKQGKGKKGKTEAPPKEIEKEAQGAVRLADPRIVRLSQSITGSRSKGSGGAFGAASPQGALRPGAPVVLSWANRLTPEQRAAAKIVVTLTRGGEREPFLTRELPGEADAFSPPEDALAGGTVVWKAEAFAPRTIPTFADGRIFRLAPAEAAAVDRTVAKAKDPLARAEILMAAGLYAEAWDAYEEARRRSPADKEILEEMRPLVRLLGRRVPEEVPVKK